MRISDWSSDVCSSDLRLDRDLRLLAAIGLIAMGALAACLMTIREVEGHLLRTTATGAAVHWAEFLQSRLRGLDEILDAGLVTEEDQRSEEHTTELQSLMRISYAVFCLQKKNKKAINTYYILYY